MLGHTFRYQIQNSTGVSVTCTVRARDFKFAPDGSRTDAPESTPFLSSSIGATAYSNGSVVDNSNSKNLGTDILFTAAPSAAATGTVTLFFQRSTDGGATWPNDGQGQWLATIQFSSSTVSVTVNAVVR